MRFLFAVLLPLLALACARGTPAPPLLLHLRAGEVSAMVHLPDAQLGHYRGSRFDWSGMIGELRFGQHIIWNEWNASDDATGHHDNAVGAAMEFGMNTPLGFDDAQPGEGFIKIGVGVLRKPDGDQPYSFYGRYEFVETPVWEVSSSRDSVTFRQSISRNGYGYNYTKRVTVRPAGLIIQCELINTGQRPISTEVYNHNFLRLGGRGFEPPLQIQFVPPARFSAKAKGREHFEIDDTIRVARALMRGSVWAPLEFEPDRVPGTFVIGDDRVEVQVEHDAPVARYVLYGLPEFVSIEPFTPLSLTPGQRVSWSYIYTIRPSKPALHSP